MNQISQYDPFSENATDRQQEKRNMAQLWRCELIAIGILALIVVALFAAVVILFGNQSSGDNIPLGTSLPLHGIKESNHEDVCTTEGCVQAASHLLKSMNTSADPCNNFYEFACGQWAKNNPNIDDRPIYGTFYQLDDNSVLKVKTILEEKEKNSEPRSYYLVRKTYKSCMDKAELNRLKEGPLIEDLNKLAKTTNLSQLVAIIRRDHSVETLFQLQIYEDQKNTSNIINIAKPRLQYSSKIFINPLKYSKEMNAYKQWMSDIINTLQWAHLKESDIDKIIEFETNIAKIKTNTTDDRNLTSKYHKITIKEFDEIFPQIKLQKFISYAGREVSDEMEIVVDEPEYYRELSILISKTNAEDVRKFLYWKMVKVEVLHLDERFDVYRNKYQRTVKGKEDVAPRWNGCIRKIISKLSFGVGSMFSQAFFNENDKIEAQKMVVYLKKAMTEILQNNDWMDNSTREAAIEKTDTIHANIGYPEFSVEPEKLDEYYSELNITDIDGFYTIMKKINIWKWRRVVMTIGNLVDRSEFHHSPAQVGAMYSPTSNTMTFLAAMLQPPVYSGTFPKSVNFGAIGTVIGHEITHGFDDTGSQYDKNGILRNWWTEESQKQFEERKKCIIDQYSAYKIPNTNYSVNGEMTQGENIADNGGLKEAFKAYQMFVKENGEEKRLPGLQAYTNEQIFFISMGHTFCGYMTNEVAQTYSLTNVHSPLGLRAIGMVQNNKDFAEAFNCPLNSKYNPEKKCSVW